MGALDAEHILRVARTVSKDTPIRAWYTVLKVINAIQCYSEEEERDGRHVAEVIMRILGHLVRSGTLPMANEELVWTYVVKKFGTMKRGRQGKADMAWVKKQRESAREKRHKMAEEYAGRSIRKTWLYATDHVRWPVADPETLTDNATWSLNDQLRYGGSLLFSYPVRVVDAPRPSIWFHFRETETPTSLLPVVVVNGKLVNWLRSGDGTEYKMRSFCVDAHAHQDPFTANKVMFVYMFPSLAKVDALYRQTLGALGSVHVEFRVGSSSSPRFDTDVCALPVVDVQEIMLPDPKESPRSGDEGCIFVMDAEEDEEKEEDEIDARHTREKPFIFVACGHALTDSDIDVYRRFKSCPVCGDPPGELPVVRASSRLYNR